MGKEDRVQKKGGRGSFEFGVCTRGGRDIIERDNFQVEGRKESRLNRPN